MLRVLLTAAGSAGLFLFILPAVMSGIINIGNVTGTCVSAAAVLYGAFQKGIHAGLMSAWNRGPIPLRTALILAGAGAAAIAVTALVLTLMMVEAACRRPGEDAVVIVLGCEVRGDRASRMLTSRMEAAVSWLQEHPEAICVLSGGRGETEEISEAECMYRYMTARGIRPDRLLMEDRSMSTRENILYSLQVLEEAGAGFPGEAAIVTNEFHVCRAGLIAKKLGLRTGSVPATSPWWLLPTFYVRELYGLLYQIFL